MKYLILVGFTAVSVFSVVMSVIINPDFGNAQWVSDLFMNFGTELLGTVATFIFVDFALEFHRQRIAIWLRRREAERQRQVRIKKRSHGRVGRKYKTFS